MKAMNSPSAVANKPNPLLADWTGPLGLPPFAAVRPEHFRPAFDAGLAAHRAELDGIAANPVQPSFANTIEALERSGRPLDTFARASIRKAGRRIANVQVEAWQEQRSAPIAVLHGHFLIAPKDDGGA